MPISCVWPLGASDINIHSTGCCYPLLSDTDTLCGIGRDSEAKATNLHLQWGENSIGLIFCIRPPPRPPQPPPCPQLQLCSPVLKDPEEYCLCHPAVWGRRIREVLIPIVHESGGGVGGCKMIQPATLIPPYHFRLHIKPPPPSHKAAVLCVGPQCANSKGENGAKKKLQQQSRIDLKTVAQKIGWAPGRGWGRLHRCENTRSLCCHSPPQVGPWCCCSCSFIGLLGNQNVSPESSVFSIF